MALPTNLANKVNELATDPSLMATELQVAYLLSFYDHPPTSQSLYTYPRDTYQSPLESYQYVDFDQNTYDQVLKQSTAQFKVKNKQVLRGIRSGFKQFFARIAAKEYEAALAFMRKQNKKSQKAFTLAKQEEQYRIEGLRGNNPTKWPQSVGDFLKEINALPWHAFCYDSVIFLQDFIEAVKTAIIQCCRKAKIVDGRLDQKSRQNLTRQIQAFTAVILRTNNQEYILEQINFLSDLQKHIALSNQDQTLLCQRLQVFIENFFKLIPHQDSQAYHYPDGNWNKKAFTIVKKQHFQRLPGLGFYSIATDGKFLYFYVSAINGGIYKIGTGQQGTVAGRVYQQRAIHYPVGTKVDEISWVFLQGKLYLKTSSRDPWILQVINPETLKKEGLIQLFCPALFGQQSLVNLNKTSRIMTDGTSLYYLGSRIRISKGDHHQKKDPQMNAEKSEQKKDLNSANDKRKKRPKKFDPPPQPQANKSQNYQKVLQIVLYEFSLDGSKKYQSEDLDEKDLQQLYDSFSGYFTIQECRRALIINNLDLAETCQWLFNEGEKEKQKNIKVFEQVSQTVLMEAEITSNFQQRGIKGPSEIGVKDGSILTIMSIFEHIWTMDRSQITCYSQQGVKIFSKDMKDYKINPQTKLCSTLVKSIDIKFRKNPQYCMLYDPVHSLFYTFSWPENAHEFPAIVLVAQDTITLRKDHQQKKKDIQIQSLSSLKNLSRFCLLLMNLVDKKAVSKRYRFNDWLWFYGQRVLEIGKEISQSQDKKRLANKRTKVLAKMNKLNQHDKTFDKNKAIFAQKGKIVNEVTKIYPFQSEGTVRNYHLIARAFQNIDNDPEEVYLYALCVENWLAKCSTISKEIKPTLLQIGQNLFRIKGKSEKNRKIITKLLINQFNLFFPSASKQIEFLLTLNEEQLFEFLHAKISTDSSEYQSIIFELTKKDHLIQKYQVVKCDFQHIFKNKSDNSQLQPQEVDSLGTLLLGDILVSQKGKLTVNGAIDSTHLQLLREYFVKQGFTNKAAPKLLQFLFLSSLKFLSQNCSDFQNFIPYQIKLFAQVLSILEKILLKSRPHQLLSWLPTFLMIVIIYHGSLISVHAQQSIIVSLLKCLQHIQRPQFISLTNLIQDSEFQGISATCQKSYQSSHPVQRGKNYNYPARTFPNASFTLLDLDKRCQSESNNDNLSIQIVHQDSQVGNSIPINDGVFFTNLGLSGHIDAKRPYLLFGNSITVDFNSSPQVRDTQSLVRFGFKFGLRPVYTSSFSVKQENKSKILKTFGSFFNFQLFANVVKFTTVTISNAIQNYLHLQNSQNSAQINTLLKANIFKQGVEQNAFQFDKKHSKACKNIRVFMQSQNHTQDRAILKMSHQIYWPGYQEPKKQAQVAQILWNFEGIPAYIRDYLQQIRDFKGDFVSVFTDAREMAKEKGVYAHMMRKKSFQEDHKQLWLQGQALLFLTILKHSGMLQLNLKFSIQYIKENLKAFEDARNEIYQSFISRIQNVKEWRDMIEIYTRKNEPVPEIEIKQEIQPKKAAVKEMAFQRKGKTIKAVKIGKEKEVEVKKEKVQVVQKKQPVFMKKDEFQRQIRERLGNNDSMIKGICRIRNILYNEDNQYETITHIIDAVISEAQTNPDSPDTAYSEPIQHLIRCCLFLLKFKSPSTKESLEKNENIVPISIGRSLSSDHRVDTNKVKVFRQWLQNWKKWKTFSKQGKVQLKFPVQQIVKYVNSWIKLDDIHAAIAERYHKCQNRISFYSNTTQLIKTVSQPQLLKYLLGVSCLNLQKNYDSNLQSIGDARLNELKQSNKQYESCLKNIQESYSKQLPTKLNEISELVKNNGKNMIQKIRLFCNKLFMLQSDNPIINLELILFLIPFKYISSQNEDIIYLVSFLIHQGFLSQNSPQLILSLISKQIGSNNIGYKRWKDLFFSQRMLFLLRKLENCCRSNLSFADKQNIAQSLFYLLYHIQVPLVVRLSLKILKKLDINLKEGIKTPLQFEYRLFKANQKKELTLKQVFRLNNQTKNNLQLMCCKINDIFSSDHVDQLQRRFSQIKQRQQDQKFNVILNLHQEQDLYWMIKVLYYIDELEQKLGQKQIVELKDWQDYLQSKNRKKQQGKKEQQKEKEKEAQKEKEKKKQGKDLHRGQRIFNNLPNYSNISDQLQSILPIGWYFSYCDVFTQERTIHRGKKVVHTAPVQPKNPKAKGQNNNNIRKQWVTPLLTQIGKRYEQFMSHPPEQPKEQDSIQAKNQYIKAKNFQNRVRKYLNEIHVMIDSLHRNGYYLLKENVSRSKMAQVCQLISAGSTNKLKDIELQLTNNEVKTKLIPNDFTPNFLSKVKITVISNHNYGYFDHILSDQINLRLEPHMPYYTQLGRTQLALEDSNVFLPYQQFLALDQPAQDEDIQFGKQWIQSKFYRMKKKTQKIYLKGYPLQTFYLSQGGMESGIKENILVPAFDSSLTLQTAPFQHVLSSPQDSQKQYQQTEMPQELIQKIKVILQKGPIDIKRKQDVRQYLLLTFYLQKLNQFDLQYISGSVAKEFAALLWKFTQNLQSHKKLSQYMQNIQKLVLKLIDNQHSQLHLFGNYLPEQSTDEQVEEYMIQIRLQKLNSSNQVKQESTKTHHTIRSNYLLKSQPPQIEENKLLKYWEKHIIPRIQEFCKSQLTDFVIRENMEQIRIQLRANNHTQAKRKAFLICQHKMPGGAVLPDSNHNWNALEIQEIQVGSNVLVKIPKNKCEVYSPLLGWGGHQQRLGKVIFVEIRTKSVLIRYRIEQLAIFSYVWVPVTCLMAAEKEVLHISTPNIYEQLTKNIEGVTYIHAKHCFTKLAGVVSKDENLKLITQTIGDLFIDNPISGWIDNTRVWSMRSTFQAMVEKGQLAVLDLIQKKFCRVRGIDLNLNSQRLICLNRVDQAKALLISFKKQAKLSLCSGIRFYSDKYGFNQIAHLYTRKKQRTQFEPLEFKQPDIYCRFYANKEVLPIYQQIQYVTHPLEATVFGIDDMWTLGCYIAQVLAEIALKAPDDRHLVLLTRINRTFIRWLVKKSVSILCSHLAKLSSKITMTVNFLLNRKGVKTSLQDCGVTIEQLTDLLSWIETLNKQQSQQTIVLYSAIIQNLSELVASILLRLPQIPSTLTVPQHIKAMIVMNRMLQDIATFSQTKKMSLAPELAPAHQWQRILKIAGIPSYLNKDRIKQKVIEIVQKNSGKILCPKYDVWISGDECFILVQGWDTRELVQQQLMQKINLEQPQVQEERPMTWICSVCTFENPMGLMECDMCGAAYAPSANIQEQNPVLEAIEAADLKAAQKRLKDKQAKRFQEVKNQIIAFFEEQYKEMCQIVQKKNIEVDKKSKQMKKPRKGQQVQKQEPIQRPVKPDIKLTTGSAVFEGTLAEQFLKLRYQALPQTLRKLVSQQNTFIAKFRKFLQLGYDLWGDNIASPDATLIPFVHLQQLMEYVQTDICKDSSTVLSYSQEFIRIMSQIPLLGSEDKPVNYSVECDTGVRVKYSALGGQKSYNIRYSWRVVKELNLAASDCLQFINMNHQGGQKHGDLPSYTASLGEKVQYFRNLIMGVIKLQLSQKIIMKTSLSGQTPKIELERLKVRQNRSKQGIITQKQKDDYIFTKAHHQLIKISPALLRPFKPKGADPYIAFNVVFKGENVMGQAGPYRQFFTDISRQLAPNYGLGLFIPSPNSRHQSGDNRSRWVVNPKANSSYHLSLFQVIGVIMGCCFRTGSHMAIDLPLLFWKAITHEAITAEDLDEVDSQLNTMINNLKDCPSAQVLEEATDQYGGPLTWTYKTSDDQIHEMIPNGKNTVVEFADLQSYISKLRKKRIQESKLQIKRIVKGLSQLIPLPYLYCLTGHQLKMIVCGRPTVDVQLLKKHTKYSGGLTQQSKRIKMFWQVLREMSQPDRLKLIRFCWGQQRLPINSQQFQRNNIRFMIKPMMTNSNRQDQALPKADTCFFNIEIPDYSTKEVMRERILLAVNLDNVSINADQVIVQEDDSAMNQLEYNQDLDYDQQQA